MYLEVEIAPPLYGEFRKPLALRLLSKAFAILKDLASQHFQHLMASLFFTACSILLLFSSFVMPAYHLLLSVHSIEFLFIQAEIAELMLLYVLVCVGGTNFAILKILTTNILKTNHLPIIGIGALNFKHV